MNILNYYYSLICRTFVSAVFLSFIQGAMAEELNYHPFVAEAKVWKCYYFTNIADYTINENERNLLFYYMQGDTLINDKVYKKVFCSAEIIYGDVQQHYFCSVREESKQVFVVSDKKDREQLLYDFNTPDEMVSLSYGSQEFIRGVADACSGYGMPILRYYYLYAEDEQGLYAIDNLWVEGVGSIEHPFSPVIRHISSYEDPYPFALVHACSESDRTFFTEDNLLRPTPVSICASTPQKVVPAFFDLQGRRLNAAPARGLYVKDGRKYVK